MKRVIILLACLLACSFSITNNKRPVLDIPVVDIQLPSPNDSASEEKEITNLTSSQKNFHEALLEQGQSSLPYLQEFVGNSYNLFRGDPLAQFDNGFTGKSVFTFTYGSKTTKDGQFIIPKEVAQISDKVKTTTESDILSGPNGYLSTLMRSITLDRPLSFNYGDWFTGGMTYPSIEPLLVALNLVKYKCSIYTIALKKIQTFSPQFLAAIEDARKNNNWETFINNWGTHYAAAVSYGATAIQSTQLNINQVMDLLTESSINLDKISATLQSEYNPLGLPGPSYNSESPLEGTLKTYYTNALFSRIQSAYAIGAPIPSSNKLDDWVEKIRERPAPTSYQLNYIGDLFISKYLGSIYSSDTLASMKSGYEAVLNKQNYCFSCSIKKITAKDIPLVGTKILYAHSQSGGSTTRTPWLTPSVLSNDNAFWMPTLLRVYFDEIGIFGLGLQLEDKASSPRTVNFGRTSSKYSDIPINFPSKIDFVEIHYEGIWIVGLKIYVDGIPRTFVGRSSQTYSFVKIEGFLTGFKGQNDNYLVALGFISKVYAYSPETSVLYHTEYFGGNGGSDFYWTWSDFQNPSAFMVRTGDRIDSVGLTYNFYQNKVGGNGGTLKTTNLFGCAIDEIKVIVYARLQYMTLSACDKTYTYGQDTFDTPLKYTFPANEERALVGYYGRSGLEMDRLGFIFRIK